MIGTYENAYYQVTWKAFDISYIMMPPPGQYNSIQQDCDLGLLN